MDNHHLSFAAADDLHTYFDWIPMQYIVLNADGQLAPARNKSGPGVWSATMLAEHIDD